MELSSCWQTYTTEVTVAVTNKSSAVAEMMRQWPKSKIDMGRKEGAAVPLSQGSWVSV